MIRSAELALLQPPSPAAITKINSAAHRVSKGRRFELLLKLECSAKVTAANVRGGGQLLLKDNKVTLVSLSTISDGNFMLGLCSFNSSVLYFRMPYKAPHHEYEPQVSILADKAMQNLTQS
jgi:hypothetical protein